MPFLKTLDTIIHCGSQQPESYERKKLYTFHEVLGSGSFGSVKKATRNSDGKEVAIKLIPKNKQNNSLKVFEDEVNILKRFDHPNVIHFYDSFESREKFYIVSELATGGELFERVLERGKFTEKDAVQIIKSVLEGLEHVHSHNIVHRDLKPENLLFKKRESDELAICDFGIASEKSEASESADILGSPGYVAPEVLLKSGYDTPADMWAVGVITYSLLCGYQPFQAENKLELFDQITHARYDFHDRYWKDISFEARAFIKGLLNLDDKKRLTATQALENKWITSHSTHDTDILPTVRKNFNARKTFHNAVDAIRAANRLKSTPESSHTDSTTVEASETTQLAHTAFAKMLASARDKKKNDEETTANVPDTQINPVTHTGVETV